MHLSYLMGVFILAAAAPAAADKPVPQDHARMEKRPQERLEWNRQTLGKAYEKLGAKNPRWDAAANEALERAAQMFSVLPDHPVTLAEVNTPARKAYEAGCRDPLILYIYARTSVNELSPDAKEYSRRVETAATAMTASRYSPFRKAFALRSAADYKAWKKDITAQDRESARKQLDAAIDLVGKSVAEDPRNYDWEDRWFDLANQVIELHRRLGGDYKAAFDRVDARLARIKGIEALRLAVKGNFLMLWGWEARTQRFARLVTEDQFRTFGERLQEARKAMNEAWEANHNQPHVAQLMVDIDKSIGEGDRDVMETWFERAMNLDGNDYNACWGKLDWLDPKWHGGDSYEPLIAFGRACLATKNWQTRIPLLAADAHWRYAYLMSAKDRVLYLRDPKVWSDIEPAYEEYFKHFPGDHEERSRYAAFCYNSARYPAAKAEFDKLGENLREWRNFPKVPLENLKKMREEAANVVAGRIPEGAERVRIPDAHKP